MKIIRETDENYPEKLRQIYGRPAKLYIEGNTNILNSKSIAIIGSIVDKMEAVLASRFFRPDVYNRYARTVTISDNAIDGVSTSILVN